MMMMMMMMTLIVMMMMMMMMIRLIAYQVLRWITSHMRTNFVVV